MWTSWDNLGATDHPTYKGGGGRIVLKDRTIMPAPPAHCPPEYRAKYLATFGVDPMCTPYVTGPTITLPPAVVPGSNNPTPTPVIPYAPPVAPVTPSAPSIPITPIVGVPTVPVGRPRPRRPRETMPVGRDEICPSYGHVNRQIPGVDEYQVVRCTPGQRVVIDRGLARAVRSEALARHPGGGRERIEQAGDYRGGSSGGYSGIASGGNVAPASSGGLASGLSGSICIPTWGILAAVAAFFLMKRR